MSFKKFSSSVLLLGWILGVFWAGRDIDAQDKEAKAKPVKSLIRKDLLVPREGELPFPRRNIFSPDGGSSAGASLPVMEELQVPSQEQAEVDANEAQSPSGPTLNITYIGFINSAKTRIGLILLDGEPMAVKEGERLRQNFKVEKITPKEIELSGPDSKTLKFLLAVGKGEDS